MKSSRPEAKALLRKVLEEHRARFPYVSVPAVRAALVNAGATVQPATVNRYLVEFLRAGLIHDAGRGWYSFLKDAIHLNHEPVAELVAEVRKAFPLLRFAAWSTAQVNPWMHHLIGQPVAILDVEKDALDSVADRLEAANWKPAVNPHGASVRRFAPNPRSVVLRPLHSAAPKSPDGFASPEQALVELRLESGEPALMALAEFQAMATRLATERRLTVATLLRYADKRRLTAGDLFQNQLTALFEDVATD